MENKKQEQIKIIMQMEVPAMFSEEKENYRLVFPKKFTEILDLLNVKDFFIIKEGEENIGLIKSQNFALLELND